MSEYLAISKHYNNNLKLLNRHLVALRNNPVQLPEFQLKFGFPQFFFQTTSFLTAGVELNTGVYPMKADAWAIAMTAKRRVRNLFMVDVIVFWITFTTSKRLMVMGHSKQATTDDGFVLYAADAVCRLSTHR